MSLIEFRDVSVTFGGVAALKGVSMSAEPGRIHGLIGPNGAGKSTLFNVACGLTRPDQGSVFLDGADITSLGPHRRARRGLARTFQQLELFGVLSVYDNVRTAAEIRRGWSHDRTDVAAETRAALTRTGLLDRAGDRADALSTGSARLLEIARALVSRPKLLLLDEPAAGLDEHETQALGSLLTELVADGLGIVLVEHDVDLVMKICASVTVLDLGCVLISGTPDEVRASQDVLDAYLGTAVGGA